MKTTLPTIEKYYFEMKKNEISDFYKTVDHFHITDL